MSNPVDSAINATTKFATDTTFDEINNLKFDDVKNLGMPKPPKGFITALTLHGAARFFNKITFNKVTCFRNWKETSGSNLIKTLNFDKKANDFLDKVKGNTSKIQIENKTEAANKGFIKFLLDLKSDLVKCCTGQDQLGKDIDNLTELVLTVILKNSDPEKPDINDNALTRILQIVGTLYQNDEAIKGFVDAAKKTFFDVVFSEDFINNFFEGHKHLPRVANFVVGTFHVRGIVDKVLDEFILNNPKNNLNNPETAKTAYQKLLKHGLGCFFNLNGGKLDEDQLKGLIEKLPEKEKKLCKDLQDKEQGFWMRNILKVSKFLCSEVKGRCLQKITKGWENYKYEPKKGELVFKERFNELKDNYKASINELKENYKASIVEGVEKVFTSIANFGSAVVNGVGKMLKGTAETAQNFVEGVKEGTQIFVPNGDENGPGMFNEDGMWKAFGRCSKVLNNMFGEIDEQENEIKLQKAQNQKEEGIENDKSTIENLQSEELANLKEAVEQNVHNTLHTYEFSELRRVLEQEKIDLGNILGEIKTTEIKDGNVIQDTGLWTAKYPLNKKFKEDLRQGDRINFQVNEKNIEFNKDTDDLAKAKIVAAHNMLVDNNYNADATNAFTEISKIANKDTILKLLPENFKRVCEEQGLSLANGAEPIDGKIQYTINITEKNPLKVKYEISYPLITDKTKDPNGRTKEIGSIKLTFNTEYKTVEKKGIFYGWTRTYDLQSVNDLKIEVSEKQKQENDDDSIV